MAGNSRHPNLFTRENALVLLIDFQERFLPILHNRDETIKNIKLLLGGVNIYSLPIIVTEQVPEKLGPTISDFKEYLHHAKFFYKKTMSCCGQIGFLEELKKLGVKRIVVCGIEAHVCVLQTALDLIYHGFQVQLACDAITTRIPYNKEIAIEKMKSSGVIVSSVETVLFEITYTAGTEEFKKLQRQYELLYN